MGLKIDRIWAFVAVDDNGDEGIMSALMGEVHMPLIGADMDRVNQLRGHAELISKLSGVRYELRYFKLDSDPNN